MKVKVKQKYNILIKVKTMYRNTSHSMYATLPNYNSVLQGFHP